jgi:uncharacterized protein (TIGR02246 family)
MTENEIAIHELVATWLRATEAGEDDKVLQLMAEDVVFLASGQQPMQGKASFAFAQKAMKNFKLEVNYQIQEIKISGDLAFCWNQLTVSITPINGGNMMKRAGNVLSILEKQDGKWVITRDANMLVIVP